MFKFSDEFKRSYTPTFFTIIRFQITPVQEVLVQLSVLKGPAYSDIALKWIAMEPNTTSVTHVTHSSVHLV